MKATRVRWPESPAHAVVEPAAPAIGTVLDAMQPLRALGIPYTDERYAVGPGTTSTVVWDAIGEACAAVAEALVEIALGTFGGNAARIRTSLGLPDVARSAASDSTFERTVRSATRVMRPDLTVRDGHPYFYELNATSCIGLGPVHDALLSSYLMSGTVPPTVADRPGVVEALVDAATTRRQGRVAVLAVVSWREDRSTVTGYHYEALAAAMRARGVQAVACAAEDLRLEPSGVYLGATRVDAIYRHVRQLGDPLPGHVEFTTELSALERRGAVDVFTPLGADLFLSKAALSWLSDEEVTWTLPAALDRACSYVPWTRVLERRRTAFEGDEVDLVPFVVDNKDLLVLKPAWEGGASNVAVGQATAADEWRSRVLASLDGSAREWIVQRLVQPPDDTVTVVDDDELRTYQRPAIMSAFFVDGRMAGLLQRLGGAGQHLVSGGTGAVVRPILPTAGDRPLREATSGSATERVVSAPTREVDSKRELVTRVAVIGVGTTGRPLVDALDQNGVATLAVDTDLRLVDRESEAADSHVKWATPDGAPADSANAVFVCVPTGLTNDGRADLAPLQAAVLTAGKMIRRGGTLVIQSTVPVGTTRAVAHRLASDRQWILGRDLHVAMVPERIDPANEQGWNIANTPRVVGGVTDLSALAAAELLSQVRIPHRIVANAETAEFAKLQENTFRLVNIALANELSDLARCYGIDPIDALRAAGTKPFGFLEHVPGPGVGGECIPVDPNFLLRAAGVRTPHAVVLPAALRTTAKRPVDVAELALELSTRFAAGRARIALVGVAYKPEVADVRESPSLVIARELLTRGADVAWVDPHVRAGACDGEQIPVDTFDPSEFDLVVLLTPHADLIKQIPWASARLVLDTRYVLPIAANTIRL